MPDESFKCIVRPATAEERRRHAEIRRQVEGEFPPKKGCELKAPPQGIPTQIRRARESQGLSWYALAKRAGVPNANTIRDIEAGRDAQVSTVQVVAAALGLRLELVEELV